jgi:hypothetical protein
MALSQKAVQYDGRNELQDPVVRRALDHILSQLKAGIDQVKATPHGKTPAPTAPDQLVVSASGGFARIAVSHRKAPSGTAYVLEYSTTKDFLNPVRIDNGISKSWGQYLSGKTLYFRAASTFYTSDLSKWTYFGSSGSPTPTTF